MRAAILQTARGPFCQTSISRPEPGPSEVLIRIAASGISPLDTKIQMGEAAHAGHALPAILGLDLAGTVEALGDGVTRFRIGDQVYGMTGDVGNIRAHSPNSPTPTCSRSTACSRRARTAGSWLSTSRRHQPPDRPFRSHNQAG
jgi:NADPH:quinone reductase-like Zn-dependent oxidoreductase